VAAPNLSAVPHAPILTTVAGSLPFPGWLEHAAGISAAFGSADATGMREGATTAAIMDRVRAGLDVIARFPEHVPAECLSVAPDCGLSQTARWAARAEPANLVAGTRRIRETRGSG
jgi:methionine synthase II (cobalamin-independent)